MCLFNDDAEIFFNPLNVLLLRIVGENLPDICVLDKIKKINIYFLNCSKKNNVIIRVNLDRTYFVEIKN